MIFQPGIPHQLGPPNAIALLRNNQHHRAVAIVGLQHATEGASARLLGKPRVMEKNVSWKVRFDKITTLWLFNIAMERSTHFNRTTIYK